MAAGLPRQEIPIAAAAKPVRSPTAVAVRISSAGRDRLAARGDHIPKAACVVEPLAGRVTWLLVLDPEVEWVSGIVDLRGPVSPQARGEE